MFRRQFSTSLPYSSPFNLHFQEIFFVSMTGTTANTFYVSAHFQSPFSGDFLCFKGIIDYFKAENYAFQSPFSGDFLCFPSDVLFEIETPKDTFQSPFSGDFLCFEKYLKSRGELKKPTFNLHFQEIFFVSDGESESVH